QKVAQGLAPNRRRLLGGRLRALNGLLHDHAWPTLSKRAGQRAPHILFVTTAALHIVFYLVVTDVANIEVLRLGMAEVKTRHTGRRIHGIALGQLHADFLGLEYLEHVFLDHMFGAGRVTGGWTNTLVFFGNDGLVAQ